jgi:hypothetical protein
LREAPRRRLSVASACAAATCFSQREGERMAVTHDDLAASNSLADLAARIVAEHTAIHGLLSDSIRRAMAAGDLLIEAKAMVQHGQWLPWLRGHCKISERTAQLYMRCAKNRIEIEKKSASVADLTLNEAAALLALSSDVRKLFEFAKQTEGLSGEELVQACLDAGVGVITSRGYNPFAGRSDDERREWRLFVLWLARRQRAPGDASDHVEWLLQRPFQNVAEWMGEEGEKFRARHGMDQPSEAVKTDWSMFAAERASLSEVEITAEIDAFEAAQNAAPVMPAPTRKGRRK